MAKISVVGLLNAYVSRVEAGEIQFLKRGSKGQGEVLDLTRQLLEKVKEAEPGEFSEKLDWHETHIVGRHLWERLVALALHDIDPVAKGNSALLRFAEAAAKFEELLYGMSDRYRDHTIHSLWVYLMGDHILRDLLPREVYQKLDWGLRRDRTSSLLRGKMELMERKLLDKANEHKDAAWCLIALCHDLGYSLSQLPGLNERVEDVLKYLDIPGFTRIGYTFEVEHQYLGSQFLEAMAAEVWIVPSPDEKVALLKNFREAADYWRLCRALEKRQHGIYSAFLIYKLLDIFADIWMRDPAEPWGLEKSEAIDNLVRGNILFAIAQHEFEFAHLNLIGSLADILVLADELEEFSRFGRQLLERKYHDTMANVSVNFVPNGTRRGKELDINITYDVAPHCEPGEFYVWKAENLCKKYSLELKDEDSNKPPQYVIRNMNMVVRKGKTEFSSLTLSSDRDKMVGRLPQAKIGGYPAGEYSLLRQDDKIAVSIKGVEIPLNKWFDTKEETG